MASLYSELAPLALDAQPVDVPATRAFVVLCTAITQHSERPGFPDPAELVGAARLAASRCLDAESAASTTLDLAQNAIGHGRLSLAYEVLRDELTHNDEGVAARPTMRWLLAEIARLQGDWNTGLAELERVKPDLDRALEKYPNGADYFRATRARLFGTRAEIFLEVGLPLSASRAIAVEGELLVDTNDAQATLAHRIHEIELMLASEDFAGAASALEEGGARTGLTGQGTLDVYLGKALAELELEQPERPRRSAAVLERAITGTDLPVLTRCSAQRYLAEVELRAGHVESAQRLARSARASLDDLNDLERPVPLAQDVLHAALEARICLASDAGAEARRSSLERLRPAFARYLDDWARINRPPGGIGFLHIGERRALLGDLVRLTRAVALDEGASDSESIKRALGEVLRAQALGSLSLATGVGRVTLEAARKTLLRSGDHGVVIFLPAHEDLNVFAFDREAVLYERILDGPGLAQRAADFVQGLERLTARTPPSHATQRAQHLTAQARALYAELLPGTIGERFETWSAVSFVGLNELERLPPEALMNSRGLLIGEVQAVDTWPSIPAAVALASRSASVEHSLDIKLVANLAPADELARAYGLQQLALDSSDSARILSPYARDRSMHAVDGALGPAEFLEAVAGSTRVLQVFAHGVYDGSRPRGACLVLAGPTAASALVHCSDVDALAGRFEAELVVLAACGSALGPPRPGDDELAHLGGAFLTAGARAVVVSRAPLELDRTLNLTGPLHAALARGKSAAEALRTARATVSEDMRARWSATRVQIIGLGQRAPLR